MREIKFKIWDIKNKEMGKSFTLRDAIQSDAFEVYITDIFLQFTGLKDKNGKEIYEGDIIKFQMKRMGLVNHPAMIALKEQTAIYQGAVKWGEYGWRPFIDGKVEDIEVIGNIFEYPELIKQ